MKKTRRSGQVGDIVRSQLAEIVRREMNDASLGFITITDVEMTPDLRYARVFVSTLQDEQAEAAVKALRSNAPRLRYLLGQQAKLRHTPELEFKVDPIPAQAGSVERILRDVLPPERKDSDDDPRDDS